jgi:tetratricopeptide (TPR) repeat protein
MALLAVWSKAAPAQQPEPPMSRAEIMGRLAARLSPSYVGHLVKKRGTDFSPDDGYLTSIRRAGGAGILLEQLLVARATRTFSNSTASDPPFEHLAKCAEIEQSGAYAQAKSECNTAALDDPTSPWPLLALSRCLMQTDEQDEAQTMARRAVELSPKLPEAHLEMALTSNDSGKKESEFRETTRLFGGEFRNSDFVAGLLQLNLYSVNGLAPGLDGGEIQRELRAQPEIALTHILAASFLNSQGKTAEALAEMREAIRLEPDNSQMHVLLSNMYETLDQKEERIVELREALRVEPHSSARHFQLADALEINGDRKGAIAEYREVIKLNPKDDETHIFLINLYKEIGDTGGGIAEARRHLSVAPDDSHDMLTLAELLEEMNNLDESASESMELITLYPRAPEIGWAYNNLGNVRLKQQRFDEAMAAYYQAIQALPEEAVPYSNVGNTLARLNRLDEAIEQYRHALSLDTQYANAHTYLGITLGRQGNLDSAIDEFNLALAIDPNSEVAGSSLAHGLELKGNLQAAISEYEHVLAVHPESANANNNLAYIYITSADPRYRNPQAALEYARRAVESLKLTPYDTNKPDYIDTLASALLANGKSDEAVYELREVVALDPGSAKAHANLGRVLELKADHAGAISEYAQALNIHPDLAIAQNDLAWIFATCADLQYRNPSAALEHAVTAVGLLAVVPSNATKAAFLDTLAEALFVNQRFKEALENEEKAITLDPGNPDLKNRINRFRTAAAAVQNP